MLSNLDDHLFRVLSVAEDGPMELFAENLFDALSDHGVIIHNENSCHNRVLLLLERLNAQYSVLHSGITDYG